MVGKDIILQGRCIFDPHFPISMQLSNMRQTSSVSQIFNETAGFGTIFSPDNDNPSTITYLDREISTILLKTNSPWAWDQR